MDKMVHFSLSQAMARAFEAKNPKNQQEALVWLAGAVKDFGMK